MVDCHGGLFMDSFNLTSAFFVVFDLEGIWAVTVECLVLRVVKVDKGL